MSAKHPPPLFLAVAIAAAVLGLTGCGGPRVSVLPQTVTIPQPATTPRPAHVQTYTLFATQSVVEPRFSLEKTLARTLRNFQVFPLDQQQRIRAALEAEGLRPDPNNQGQLQVFAALSFLDLWGADQSSWSTHLNGGVSGSATVKIVDTTGSTDGVTIAHGFADMPTSYVFGNAGGGIGDHGWRPTPAAGRIYPTVAAAKQAWGEDIERLATAVAQPAIATAVTKALEELGVAWRGARTPVDLPFVRVDSSDQRWTSANQQLVTSCYRQRTAPNPLAIPQDLAALDQLYADLAARPQPGELQAQDVAAATWNRGVLAAWSGDETAAHRYADEAKRIDPDQGVYRQMSDVIARLGKARRIEQRASTGK